MISSQIQHYVEGFDEIIHEDDADFSRSGLKASSVIRVGRLAVVEGGMLLGSIGEIDSARLRRIKTKLADWLMQI
jgi:mRNA interferase MazF